MLSMRDIAQAFAKKLEEAEGTNDTTWMTLPAKLNCMTSRTLIIECGSVALAVRLQVALPISVVNRPCLSTTGKSRQG
jgi:hypothetical protein